VVVLSVDVAVVGRGTGGQASQPPDRDARAGAGVAREDAWTIPYIVIDKGSPLHVTRLLMPVEMVHGVSWEARRVRVSLAAEALGGPHGAAGTTR
jgi:hypothetical protein